MKRAMQNPVRRRAWRLLLPLLMACGTSAPLAQRDNLAFLYGKGVPGLRLQARAYHEGPERTLIHYKVSTADLLYKSDGNGPFKAQARITYAAYADPGARQLLDSASTLITDRSEAPSEERELIGAMELRRRAGAAFTVLVTARDLHRDSEAKVLLTVDPAAGAWTQSYMPIDPANGLPLFTDQLPAGRAVSVRCDRCAGEHVRITRSPIAAKLPAPVFSGEARGRDEPEPDSLFAVSADANGRIDLGPLPVGSYLLRAASDTTGFALHVLNQAFPYVDDPIDLLGPLRYITSSQEYERLSKADDPRKAVERFWLDATGDRERAREAIRIYYSRVENANRHFSAGIEGWRTDRGMVHIIFGTPTSIHRAANGETWTFGEENNLMSLSFNFSRRKSALTGNDYILQRDPLLKGAWYRNVESWRSGRVYQN